MPEKRAIRQNFKNLHDNANGSVLLRALTSSIILSGDEGIQKFIDDHTSGIKNDGDRGRAVSLLSGIIAAAKYDLSLKRKKQ